MAGGFTSLAWELAAYFIRRTNPVSRLVRDGQRLSLDEQQISRR
jgi:hypothetical protein